MESQLQRPHGHNYEEDPQNVGLHTGMEGEYEHHQEKISVLKKVKAKAKKIKDTITKHGHEHQHDDHQYDHDHDHEEDEDEEMLDDDPEIHGAPIYESTTAGTTDVPGQEEAYGTKVANPAGNVDHGQSENMGKTGVKIGKKTGMVEDPHGLGKYSPPNYQTKVTDPTAAGGEEAGITPILQSFNKMSVYNEPEPKSKSKSKSKQEPNSYTGIHDQFAPEPVPKSYYPTKPDDLHCLTLTKKPPDQNSYISKISSATSVIADTAISAKNIVASKLGYGGSVGETRSHEKETHDGVTKLASLTEYGNKIVGTVTEKVAPVYEKVVDAGSSVMSKVHGTDTGTNTGHESGVKRLDKGVSIKEYLSEKFKPGEEDRALSEAISQGFRKQKEEQEHEKVEAKSIGNVISDAVHKRKEGHEEVGEVKPMGKVTVSDEVARRLGTEKEGVDDAVTGNVGTGTGVVDRVKGAVSSWMGKGGDQLETSQGSPDTSSGSSTGDVGQGEDVIKERRLEESN